MERVYTTTRFSWMHDNTPVVRVVPPPMKELVDDEGNPVTDEAGDQVLIPDTDNWEQRMEEIELDTIVVIEKSDPQNPEVFKFAMDKETLARFLASYVQHLDSDGRKVLREAINQSVDIVVPDTVDMATIRDLNKKS